MTAGMKLFHCPRIITRAGSLWRAKETREGRDKWNANHPLHSKGERGHERKRLAGQKEFIYQADRTKGVYLPGWKTTWSEHSRGNGKSFLSRLDFAMSLSLSGLTSPAITQVLTVLELHNSRVICNSGMTPSFQGFCSPIFTFQRDKFHRSGAVS